MQSESIQAKIVRECIRMAAGNRLIGPKIKTGQLQRQLLEKEPRWKEPDDMTWERMDLSHFAVEVLTPDTLGKYALMQLHGGGYVNPLRNVYRNFAKKYAGMCEGIKVFSVDYRVAPEHTHPAALLDVVDAYKMILEQGYSGDEIFVAGDSAGGGLAVALCMWLREHNLPLPAKLVLMSPWLDMTASGESYEENFDKDPMFGGTKESMIYRGDYLGDYSPEEPYLSPLFGDFTDMPPMLIQVGEIEMLRSDGERAAEKAKEVGSEAKLQVYQGMFHVFQMGTEQIPESARAWEEIQCFLENE
ncbi:MAG: alpha/beta hydrolase [Lachnospiraceae bacterium]|nr:alpha/beta hydrolase [Lachnospiraceae bacterium]